RTPFAPQIESLASAGRSHEAIGAVVETIEGALVAAGTDGALEAVQRPQSILTVLSAFAGDALRQDHVAHGELRRGRVGLDDKRRTTRPKEGWPAAAQKAGHRDIWRQCSGLVRHAGHHRSQAGMDVVVLGRVKIARAGTVARHHDVVPPAMI